MEVNVGTKSTVIIDVGSANRQRAIRNISGESIWINPNEGSAKVGDPECFEVRPGQHFCWMGTHKVEAIAARPAAVLIEGV